MCAIVTAEMASLTDAELRLCFELVHGVPRQGVGYERCSMRPPGDSLGSGLQAPTDHRIEELLAWLAEQGAQEPGAGDASAE